MAVDAYYSRVNRDLLALIPPNARTVLEIGCGAGALAEAYRRMNPDVRWFGIEKDEDACDAASQRMTDCQWGDIEDEAVPIGLFFGGHSVVDCLILGDVLEHLRDPWEVLKAMTEWLKPGGLVLASIPNISHWSVIRGLLSGEWDYTEDGLLDRTHLRFFTLKSIRELFASAGLEVFEIRGRPAVNDTGHHDFLEAVVSDRLLADLEVDLHSFANQTRAFQYLVRALKPPAEVTRLHIHAVTAELCCARPRIEEPLAMLATVPGVRITQADPHIVILQRDRCPADKLIDRYRHMASMGSLLIAEWDDDPEAFPEVVVSDYLPLRAVHAIQVSTEPLAEVVRQYNPEVMVFPNMIADLPPLRKPYTGPPILFYGAQNRESDWTTIMPALNRVLADHPEIMVQVVHDKAFFEACAARFKRWVPFQGYEAYRAILRTCDIALLPLEPTRFNRMKSDLKFLECASESVACLMSEFAADQIDPHPNDAYRCWVDLDHFGRVLQNLITNPEGRRMTAEIAYAYVRNHRLLSQHFRKRLDWYRGLTHRRESLHQSLLERVPELRSPSPAAEMTPSHLPR